MNNNKIIEIMDLDFVCEEYRNGKLDFSKEIFWRFVKKANKNNLSIFINAYPKYSDFNFGIRGEESEVRKFLIENYLGGDERQFDDLVQ